MKTIEYATVVESSLTNNGLYVQATCGKTSAFVCIYEYGVNVICQNASHKVWKKSGKMFSSVDAALQNYKSQEMKAIIQAANTINH